MHDCGTVGEIGSRFYDRLGRACCEEFNQRVVGLILEEIARAPMVIGVAGGDCKIEVIHAILKNNILNILITDDVVTRTIRERNFMKITN